MVEYKSLTREELSKALKRNVKEWKVKKRYLEGEKNGI